MGLGGIIGDAINAGLGKSYSTDLQGFLSNFSSNTGKHIIQLNPLNTFEVKFKIKPTDPNEEDPKSDALFDFKAAGGALSGDIARGAVNALDNAIGGIASAIASGCDEGVLEKRKTASDISKNSFLHYLVEANLLIDSGFLGVSTSVSKPLQFQLGYYIQDITIPQLRIADGEQIQTMVGNIQTHGIAVVPDNNNLQMTVLNTRLPLIERFFYPWMREVTLPYWSYNTQPYTTATIVVDFSKHTDMQYVFTGCRPTQIQMMTASQENDQSFRRQVTFTFDFMYISSKLDIKDDWFDKLVNLGGTLGNSAAGMIGL